MSILEQAIQELEDKGVVVARDIHGIKPLNQDLSIPYISITICTQGSARAYFDMREYTQSRNQLSVIIPGHIVRPVECSEDYIFTRLAISRKMLDELRNYLFSHDYAKFHYNPVCSLTDLNDCWLLWSNWRLSPVILFRTSTTAITCYWRSYP